MILVDTGPLIALIDKGQGDTHVRCVQTYQTLRGEPRTTWPCFTIDCTASVDIHR